MIKSSSLFLILALLSTAVKAQLSEDYKVLLDAKFEQRTTQLRLKGAAAAVAFSDGSVWSSAAGKYGDQTLTTDLLYEIGSNTKTMVATTVLLLRDEGKIKLSDTLYQYLSPITNVSYGITIEQLLRHRTGLFNYTNHPDFGAFLNANWTSIVDIADLYANFLDVPTAMPDEEWSYSNTNFILLGQVIEAIEGKPLHQVFSEKLFTPLGLSDIHLAFYDTYDKTHLGTWLAGGTYLEEPGRAFITSAWAAGGLIATPEDFARYAYQLYSGNILSDSSYTLMTETQDIGGGTKHGLALFEDIYKGNTYYGHGGTTLQNSEMQYSVGRDFSVVTIVIEQNKASQANLIQNTLIDAVEGALQKLNTLDLNYAPAAHIYPNPAGKRVTVRVAQPASITLYNPLGMALETMDIAGEKSIDVAALVPGIYTVKLSYTGYNTTEIKRLIIQ